MTVVESACVVHREHVPVLGLDGATLGHTDHVDLKFGDLGARERGSGQRQHHEYTA